MPVVITTNFNNSIAQLFHITRNHIRAVLRYKHLFHFLIGDFTFKIVRIKSFPPSGYIFT
ncbi:hypothetical protein RO04_06085 [Aggregatibacter actinomycetemcomitans]|uniref:Uncharacterized protein n=1 Tax=Aggregatibacter actinomycetemcomitans TaxID=714 RepID=A0A2G1DQ45_AGGAC|nr:hypothetical protein RO04_06085 [Aggregatibacter actinomycetemcomitans]PHO20550.1 hypothetical protein CQR80_06545 [Aggregatibacter actinomycetemcomitans]PHO21882.1 hypothetical protein CQR79_11165 [Aggregatibacter actinomycetemcomitans]TYA20213.1 hypothetical protein FXE08_11160 [Aggregatibacter actinomycetemcomitans]TYA34235.1 hypothetical protein FXB68_09615 [Aggregatibacter actinomycetemcomitans]